MNYRMQQCALCLTNHSGACIRLLQLRNVERINVSESPLHVRLKGEMHTGRNNFLINIGQQAPAYTVSCTAIDIAQGNQDV